MPLSGYPVSLVCLAAVRIVIPTLLQFFTGALPAVGAVLYSFFDPTLPEGTVGSPAEDYAAVAFVADNVRGRILLLTLGEHLCNLKDLQSPSTAWPCRPHRNCNRGHNGLFCRFYGTSLRPIMLALGHLTVF